MGSEETRLGGEVVFEKGKVVLPLKGEAEGSYYRVDSRRDERPFDADDLHLMGATAEFLAALFAESKKHHKAQEEIRILQFLIDQLPLGIVCRSADGSVMTGNKLAWRQLGVSQSRGEQAALRVVEQLEAAVLGQSEGHFEVDGALMFAACRRFDLGHGSVSVYVLYDLSDRAAKLQQMLEREFFRCKEQQQGLSLSLIRLDAAAGVSYRYLKSAADELELDARFVQPIDAYTTACVFAGERSSTVRRRIRPLLSKFGSSAIHFASGDLRQDDGIREIEGLVDLTRRKLQRLELAFLPTLAVLDPYAPIAETLSMLLDGLMRVRWVTDADALAAIEGDAGADFYLLDLDGFHPDQLHSFVRSLPEDRILYSSIRSRSMLWGHPLLSARSRLLQKPFESRHVLEAAKLLLGLQASSKN